MTTTGSIVRLDRERKFGFIATPGANAEFFFHKSDVEGAPFDQLTEGMAVTFEESRTSTKGPRAARVFVVPLTESLGASR